MVLSWWGEAEREPVRGLKPHQGLFELVLASLGRAKTDEDLSKVRGKGRPSIVKPAGQPVGLEKRPFLFLAWPTPCSCSLLSNSEAYRKYGHELFF